ncbi:MAG: hypothetical protein ACE5HA_16255 [Anaerolineae bacterium]
MTQDTITAQPAPAGESMAQPYPPSWVDRFIGWVQRRPGPSWVYLGMWLALFLVINAAKWLDGSQPVATLQLRHAARAMHGVYFLALMHYLKITAGEALRKFRPALAVSDAEYRRLHYRLTTLPARGALLASGLGAMVTVLVILLDPLPPNPVYGTSPLLISLDIGMVVFMLATLGPLVYQTIHQFVTVDRIHDQATNIDLFHPDPLYAFSGLTARTAVGYILIADLTMVFMFEEATSDPATAALLIFMTLAAAAAFVVPLLGLHRRMVEAKSPLEAAVSRRMEAAIAELHRRVDAGDLEGMSELHQAMSSLEIEREVLTRIPTWPWQPGTLRGVASAVTLPVLVWLIQQILAYYLGS